MTLKFKIGDWVVFTDSSKVKSSVKYIEAPFIGARQVQRASESCVYAYTVNNLYLDETELRFATKKEIKDSQPKRIKSWRINSK